MTPPNGGLRVLVFAPRFLPGFKAGGPVRSVAWTLETLDSARALLITMDRDLGDAEPYPGLTGSMQQFNGHDVYYWDTGSLRQCFEVLRLVARERWSVLYLNGYWTHVFSLAPALLRRLGIIRAREVLLAPRGELADGAMAIKSWKKRILGPAYGAVYRSNRVIFHSTAQHERKAIESRFAWARVISAPAGQTALGASGRAESGDTPQLVYVSRVSSIKNTHLLLDALAQLDVPVVLDIYGPIEDDAYWARCQEGIAAAPDSRVQYHGPLDGSRVRETFAEADVFCLPTQGENHGHAIAEALSVGCAVVVPDTTPWTEVVRDGGGELIERLDADGVAAALNRALARWASEGDTSAKVQDAYARWLSRQNSKNAVEKALEMQAVPQ